MIPKPRRLCKCLLLTSFVCWVLILYWISISKPEPEPSRKEPTLSVVMFDFYKADNHVALSASYIVSNHSVPVYIVTDTTLYPPLNFDLKENEIHNIKYITLKPRGVMPFKASRPEMQIKSDFVLFIPDGAFINKQFMSTFRNLVSQNKIFYKDTYAIPIQKQHLTCYEIDYAIRNWTLKIGKKSDDDGNCGLVHGAHGLLLGTRKLEQMIDPFLPQPFLSLYIQIRGLVESESNVHIVDTLQLDYYTDIRKVQMSWPEKNFVRERTSELYKQLGIKLVDHHSGHKEWYGCTKETQRCFDTVYNDMPEFIVQGKWTPPCCLENLRTTARHVFAILDSCKVRYWLEGGSLLGAARHEDIIPWDYDVDVGIYREDIIKCTQLLEVSKKGFIDEAGFSWEKAIEGDFYRVQFSETNHLHVDIFPFYPKDGIMTKDTWFKTHRQDTEFPEHYLKPLTRMKFVGVDVSAPNNVKKFLEYKFGERVIEDPRYPDLERAS